MIMLLEGADGGGKTTLANYYRERGWAYVHHSMMPDLFEEFCVCLGRITGPTIIDRLHLSEQVYGPIYRGRDSLGNAQARMLERVLLGKGAVVVYAKPPWSCCENSFMARQAEEMLDTTAQLRQVYDRYDEVMAQTALQVISYDFTIDRPESVIERAWWPQTHAEGIGHLAPGVVLLVGDQVNLNHSPYGWPFVAATGCSPWLAEQLQDAGISENSLYWVNAKHPDGSPTDPTVINQLQPQKIVALGAKAAAWLDSYNLPYARVSHPQYWKRFHAHEPYPLLQELL